MCLFPRKDAMVVVTANVVRLVGHEMMNGCNVSISVGQFELTPMVWYQVKEWCGYGGTLPHTQNGL